MDMIPTSIVIDTGCVPKHAGAGSSIDLAAVFGNAGLFATLSNSRRSQQIYVTSSGSAGHAGDGELTAQIAKH